MQDIDELILSAIQEIFQIELISTPSQSNDPLALRTLKEAPLQDDPTLTAPFVVYSNDKGREGESMRLVAYGHEAAEYGEIEIGGPIRYLYRYSALFGTPLQTTRNAARTDGATLMTRIAAALIKYADLSNILAPGMLTSGDRSRCVEGQNNRLVTCAGYDIFGGETTFYGKGKVSWQYPISWYLPLS